MSSTKFHFKRSIAAVFHTVPFCSTELQLSTILHPRNSDRPLHAISHHFPSPAILISKSSAVSVLISILKQPVPSLPLLSTLNLTTITLYGLSVIRRF